MTGAEVAHRLRYLIAGMVVGWLYDLYWLMEVPHAH